MTKRTSRLEHLVPFLPTLESFNTLGVHLLSHFLVSLLFFLGCALILYVLNTSLWKELAWMQFPACFDTTDLTLCLFLVLHLLLLGLDKSNLLVSSGTLLV